MHGYARPVLGYAQLIKRVPERASHPAQRDYIEFSVVTLELNFNY